MKKIVTILLSLLLAVGSFSCSYLSGELLPETTSLNQIKIYYNSYIDGKYLGINDEEVLGKILSELEALVEGAEEETEAVSQARAVGILIQMESEDFETIETSDIEKTVAAAKTSEELWFKNITYLIVGRYFHNKGHTWDARTFYNLVLENSESNYKYRLYALYLANDAILEKYDDESRADAMALVGVAEAAQRMIIEKPLNPHAKLILAEAASQLNKPSVSCEFAESALELGLEGEYESAAQFIVSMDCENEDTGEGVEELGDDAFDGLDLESNGNEI